MRNVLAALGLIPLLATLGSCVEPASTEAATNAGGAVARSEEAHKRIEDLERRVSALERGP